MVKAVSGLGAERERSRVVLARAGLSRTQNFCEVHEALDALNHDASGLHRMSCRFRLKRVQASRVLSALTNSNVSRKRGRSNKAAVVFPRRSADPLIGPRVR